MQPLYFIKDCVNYVIMVLRKAINYVIMVGKRNPFKNENHGLGCEELY